MPHTHITDPEIRPRERRASELPRDQPERAGGLASWKVIAPFVVSPLLY